MDHDEIGVDKRSVGVAARALFVDRRCILALLSGALACVPPWPFSAQAQQAKRVPTIGFLGSTTPAGQKEWTNAFVRRLRELGWIDKQTIRIEYLWAEGRPARATELAAEFVRNKVDIIVTNGTPMIVATTKATSEIPIVFAAAGDPVGAGLVQTLSRPGGNATGMSLQASELAAKHVELLREVTPGFRRMAILVNVNAANAVIQMREAQAAAETLRIGVEVLEIRRVEDIEPALTGAGGKAQTLYVMNEPLTVAHRARINELALAAKLPTVYAFREFVDSGGLMSYGPSFLDLFQRAAEYVDKILRGAKPGDLPVEQPTKFDLVLNLKTAKALGVIIPPTLLARADEVIE